MKPEYDTTESDEQTADDQPADQEEKQTQESDQPTEQSDDAPADDQPSEQSDDQPKDDQPSDQPSEQSDDKPADDSDPAGQSDDKPPDESDQPAQQAGDEGTEKSADQSDGGGSGDLGAGRQQMLDIIKKWMPTSLSQPMVPPGEKQDLLAKSGWTKATGAANKKVKDDGGHPATSCGDVLKTLLTLWKSNFVGAFNIRDTDATGHGPGAKKLGYYVEADGVKVPKPGDILVLRSGFGPSSVGTAGHVGILVEASETVWRTADGGGGALPDQTAKVTDRTVRLEKNIPILKSPTDGKEKQLDGWVDLDKLQQTG
jgi:hypothetical protein